MTTFSGAQTAQTAICKRGNGMAFWPEGWATMPKLQTKPLQGRLMPFLGPIQAGQDIASADTGDKTPQITGLIDTGDQIGDRVPNFWEPTSTPPAGLSAQLQAAMPDDPRSPENLGHLSATWCPKNLGHPLTTAIGESVTATPRLLPEILVTPRPRKPSPWAVDAAWRPADRQYLKHHAQCDQCKTAGRRLGNRCDIGAGLWRAYLVAFNEWSRHE